jgi:hypothetical protein
MAREGVSASGLAKPLVDDVIATVVLVRSGGSRPATAPRSRSASMATRASVGVTDAAAFPVAAHRRRAHPPHGGSQHQSPGIGWSAPGHLRQTAHI